MTATVQSTTEAGRLRILRARLTPFSPQWHSLNDQIDAAENASPARSRAQQAESLLVSLARPAEVLP